MARIAIINPEFEVSYWGLEYAQPMMGKRANMPVASLPLLAALTPEHHEVILFDENVEPLDFDLLATFDIVGVTGMSVQRFRMQTILTELKLRDAFTVVGRDHPVADRHVGDDVAHPLRVRTATRIVHRTDQRTPATVETRHPRRLPGRTDRPPRLVEVVGPAERRMGAFERG